ncbi:flagellar basal body-associated FliL family protein [Chitiniphilus purpureus]|uniref:Flagellar protein FliL n=1 Tax=Chitiniphilus purpureus TaxID=2981137 RepID=A0ABY6DSA8_9NEIS|nr:flagellar basal body-associated FliL family protein [Chitiniphilus sp. CD1]UXY17118.1 flagellar basal body-associated FliL family protein [Chitiniphilus sp. CD1]
MAEAKAAEPAPKGKKTLLIVVIIAVVVLLLVVVLGVVGYLLLKPAAEPAADAPAAEQADAPAKEKKAHKKNDPEHPPVFEKLQTVTANLSSENEEAVVQTDIVLELADAEVQAQLKNIMPRVQASVIKLIRSKTPAELRTVTGTDKLAADIQASIDHELGIESKGDGVVSVNFTTFIMQ